MLTPLSPCRFDSELSQAHEEAQRERLQREKLSREKDVLVAEVFGLKQLLEVSGPQTLPSLPITGCPGLTVTLSLTGQGLRHHRADTEGGGAGGRTAGHLLPGVKGRSLPGQGEETAEGPGGEGQRPGGGTG